MASTNPYTPLFLEPQVIQQGNHSVMTGISRPRKTQIINLDTRFSDPVGTATSSLSTASAPTGYQLNLPERLVHVRSIEVAAVEFCQTMYNFSAARGNTAFYVSTSTDFSSYLEISIPDAHYASTDDLITAVNAAVASATANDGYGDLTFLSFATSTSTGNTFCTVSLSSSASSTTTWYLRWIHPSLQSVKQNGFAIRQSLGWHLGFQAQALQTPHIALNAGDSIVATKLVSIAAPLYFFLAVDGFAAGCNTPLLSQTGTSSLDRNILARVSCAANVHDSFGDSIVASKHNGALQSAKLEYSVPGGASLQKITLYLLDEFGNTLDMCGAPLSLALIIEKE